jgi:hypothetical protein
MESFKAKASVVRLKPDSIQLGLLPGIPLRYMAGYFRSSLRCGTLKWFPTTLDGSAVGLVSCYFAGS